MTTQQLYPSMMDDDAVGEEGSHVIYCQRLYKKPGLKKPQRKTRKIGHHDLQPGTKQGPARSEVPVIH